MAETVSTVKSGLALVLPEVTENYFNKTADDLADVPDGTGYAKLTAAESLRLKAQKSLNSGLICAPLATVPEWPDNAAGTTYLQGTLPSDVWTLAEVVNGGTKTVPDGNVNFAHTATTQYLRINSPVTTGQTLKIKVKRSSGSLTSEQLVIDFGTAYAYVQLPTADEWILALIVSPVNAATFGLYLSEYTEANAYNFTIDFLYLGDGTYTSKALDGSGSGNHATVYGATPVDTVAGRGFSFDGVNDSVEISNPVSTIWTMSAWVNRVVTATFIVFGTSGNYPWAGVDSSNRLGLRDSGGSQYALSNLTIPVGSWSLLTFVSNGTTLTGYIDGLVQLTVTPTSLALQAIFRLLRLNTVYYAGTIADPRIYNRALTAEEVWELYSKPGMARMSGPVVSATATPNAIAVRNSLGNIADYWRSSSGVGGSDGNGGQPPAPKAVIQIASKAQNAYIGITTATGGLYLAVCSNNSRGGTNCCFIQNVAGAVYKRDTSFVTSVNCSIDTSGADIRFTNLYASDSTIYASLTQIGWLS